MKTHIGIGILFSWHGSIHVYSHLLEKQPVGPNVILAGCDEVVHAGNDVGMLHVDPVLEENLVLLPLELEDCSIILRDCWVRGAVDASPILESPALIEVVPYHY